MKIDYTVAIPTIPPRQEYLRIALDSVMAQEHPASSVAIARDVQHDGAWITRQRALDMVHTTWTFFLDDDDLFKPQHTRRLLETAAETDADYVYSYWDLSLSGDVLGLFGKPFDPNNPHHTTMIVGVKTELAKEVGFTGPATGDLVSGEDWRFTLDCVAAGAKIVHLPEMTWVWRHHTGNTSGQPYNWE